MTHIKISALSLLVSTLALSIIYGISYNILNPIEYTTHAILAVFFISLMSLSSIGIGTYGIYNSYSGFKLKENIYKLVPLVLSHVLVASLSVYLTYIFITVKVAF